MKNFRAFCVAFLGVLSVSSGIAGTSPEGDEPRGPEKVPTVSISQSLKELIEGKRPLPFLRLRADWQLDQNMVSAELFGRGVGIWNKRTQFRFSEREILPVLESLQKSGFGTMPSAYGQETDMLKLTGMVSVTLGPVTKTVQQLAAGEQSEPLRTVAQQVLSLSDQLARAGVSVASLAEGLQKVAEQKLEPETFELVTVRRAESLGPPEEESGWLLRLTGREARLQLFRRPTGYGPPRGSTLPEEEFRKIIGLLRGNDPDGFPQNLYAPNYTELRIQVLDQVKDLIARPYAGITPESHGKKQTSFDRIYEALRRLEQRVQREGREEVGERGARRNLIVPSRIALTSSRP